MSQLEIWTEQDSIALQYNEQIIEAGLETYMKVGYALMEIRDNRLYRKDFKTFEEYCQEKWGKSRYWAYNFIKASEVAGALKSVDNCQQIPEAESQARPLTKLDTPEQQAEAWNNAVANSESGNPTAKEVDLEVKKIKAQLKSVERELIEKDAAIAQLKEANKFATNQLQEQKELVKTTNEMMLSEAEKIAQKKVELEVKKATQPLQSQVAELNSKITQLEGEKTKAKTELETAKKAYDEGLAKFKANPDPETKKVIENLRFEYEKTKAEVERVTFALDNLKTKENQAFSATLSLERFFEDIQKVISKHPEAMIAMSSPYLDERFLAKIEGFADAFADWANNIRRSVEMARENQSKSVESVEVEVLDNDAELPLLEATPIDYFPEVEDEEEF